MRNGKLISESGRTFPMEDGVPNLVWPPSLSQAEADTQASYDRVAGDIYDAAMEWQFAVIYEKEDAVREAMLDQLDIKPDDRILEVGCGNGRDSFRLARRLGPDGALFMQDLSAGMVRECAKNMAAHAREKPFACTLDFSVSNATYLPFPDNYFDRLFHFGGFNEFADRKRAAAEFARVVKPGGMILFGDEGVAPWLRHTEFGGIVTTNNPMFLHEAPLEMLPEGARNVTVHWIMANCFYVITFVKDDGPPPLDLDLPHKGWRGGSMRTRYFGVMEGIDPKTKEMARQAAAEEKLSLSDWLDRTVREHAEKRNAGAPNDAES